jgi:hypothetical protein
LRIRKHFNNPRRAGIPAHEADQTTQLPMYFGNLAKRTSLSQCTLYFFKIR